MLEVTAPFSLLRYFTDCRRVARGPPRRRLLHILHTAPPATALIFDTCADLPIISPGCQTPINTKAVPVQEYVAFDTMPIGSAPRLSSAHRLSYATSRRGTSVKSSLIIHPFVMI